tara:strand:- start:1488 stop:2120 length:633 start_codon:yes stop_codon:yes gene_type:complete
MGYSIDSIYTKKYTLFKLGNNEGITRDYFLTTDSSDIYLDEINGVINKRYLNSRADYYLNTFNTCSNKVNKFDNDKMIYRAKNTIQMRRKTNSYISSSLHNDSTQKIIQNQARVQCSLYTMNLASLTSGNSTKNKKPWNNASDRYYDYNLSKEKEKGVDIKHNSYDRYLNRKKSNNLKTEQLVESPIKPLYGNKIRKFGLITNANCKLSC